MFPFPRCALRLVRQLIPVRASDAEAVGRVAEILYEKVDSDS